MLPLKCHANIASLRVKLARFAFVLIISVFPYACGGGGGSATTPPPTVATIVISPATATVVETQTQQFTATAKDSSGNILSAITFTWASDNASMATVDGTGKAIGVAPGTAHISASSGGITGTAALTINTNIHTITVTPSQATITVGQPQQFTAAATDASGSALTGKTFTWTSSNTGVATVDSTGKATGVAPGTTMISATSEAVTGTAALTVNIASINVTPSTATINIGQTQQFTATALDASGNTITGVTFAWSSSNTSIFTVNSSGMATGVSTGTATIMAAAGGSTGTAALTVRAPFASIQISPASIALNPTQTTQFTATALDSAGNPVSGVQFTWNSSDSTTATISNAGLATGVAIGTCTITASSGGITSKAAPLMVVSLGFLFTPDNNLTKASVANGPSGDVDFVWSAPNINVNSGVGVYFGRSTDGGNSFPTLVPVPNADGGGQPAVAVAPNSNVHVFWNSAAAATPLSNNIAMSTTTDGGTTFSGPVNVTNHLQTTYGIGASAQEDPKVYIDSAGNINVVTTLSRSLSTASFDVIYSRSTNGGASFAGPTVVFNNFALPGVNSASGPAVLSSGSNVYVAWGESPNTGSTVVEFSRSTDGGATWSAPQVLGNQDGGCSGNSCVTLGIDSSAVITAVWGGAAAPGIFFARSADGGNTFTARAQIPNTRFADLNPYAVVDTSGTIDVAWERIPPTAPGIQADIYFSRSTDGGTTWLFPVDVTNTPSDNSRTPNLAVDTNHNLNLVWMEFVAATFPTPKVAYRRAK